MNGAEIMAFSLREVPKSLEMLLQRNCCTREEVDFFVLHQANKFMLDVLRKKLNIPEAKFPVCIENCGNTVSSTIPLTLIQMRDEGKLNPRAKVMLIGFGVGYSWAACFLKINLEKQ